MKTRSFIGKLFALVAAVIAAGALSTAAIAAEDGVIYNIAPQASIEDYGIDFENAIPMPLPTVDELAAQEAFISEFEALAGESGISRGVRGTGQLAPQRLHPAKSLRSAFDDLVEPQEFGTSRHPYTTSRVDTPSYPVSRDYPFRAAGKLFFKDPATGGNFVCSASMIKRGIIVTAGHCIAKFGLRFYSNFVFVPAYNNGSAPYGSYGWTRAAVLPAYRNGTDVCFSDAATPRGVICQNDVGVITALPYAGAYPGTRVGWFGYGWNNWGFNTEAPRKMLVNQLGYPVSHDSGLRMQRTDSQGFQSASLAGNTVWGSRQTGGSSGGPEVANLGVAAALAGTAYGTYGTYNIVVGVTSWGYTSTTVKQQGASPFLSTNVLALVNAACAATPAACQ